MLKKYKDHVEERLQQGIPPLPLNAEQVADLVELLKIRQIRRFNKIQYLFKIKIFTKTL